MALYKSKGTPTHKHPSLRGRIFIIDDGLVSRDGYSKANRRVVVVNNNPKRTRIVKIKGLKDNNGKLRTNLIPIGHYKCLTKPSGIHPKVYSKTYNQRKIRVKYMKSTKCKLNRKDLNKIKGIK